MSDWDEIRRLAADLQRAQLAGASQKLSERNCIEIVTKLVELKLIDVIYTTDGKEYLTHQQLNKEIKDEVFVSGGRIGLVELASVLSIDFYHIEQTAQAIVKSDRETHLVLGQLVSNRYLEDLCRQINERLQQAGTLSIPSLTKEFDLPADFLTEQVHMRLGSVIEGFKDESDPKVILTPSHVSRNRARIRGVLSAITVPTSVSSIIARFAFQDKLFFSLAEEMIRTKRIPGQLTGGKTVAKASYIPHSYARAQTDWVENFYTSNGYLEYDSVGRLGLSDPLGFIKKKYPDEGLVFLTSCAVGPLIVSQLEVAVDEALTTGGLVDVLPLLPSVLGPEDGAQLVQSALGSRVGPSSSGVLVLGECTVISQGLIQSLLGNQESLMMTKAEQDVESGAVAQMMVDQGASGGGDEVDKQADKKEERRKKAAGGSAGGGAQGRQTKTKSTKKKGGKKRDDDWSDDDEKVGGGKQGGNKSKNAGNVTKELEFKSFAQLESDLRSAPQMADCPDEVFEELTEHLLEILNRKYREVARDKYQSSLAASLQNKRRTHGDLGEKVNTLYTTIRLGEKGVAEFKSEDHRSSLGRHLLKTYGTELVNEMFSYVAEENMIKVDVDKELTLEIRVKIINQLPKEISEFALKVHKAVNGNSVHDFISTLDANVSGLCDVMLRKPDKKKDRQILFGHRQSLLEQLNSCLDPALTLHLASLTIFQHLHGHILHASGKFVPVIIEHFTSKQLLEPDQLEILSSHQKLVVAGLGKDENDSEVNTKLEISTPVVKQLVAGLKKGSSGD